MKFLLLHLGTLRKTASSFLKSKQPTRQVDGLIRTVLPLVPAFFFAAFVFLVLYRDVRRVHGKSFAFEPQITPYCAGDSLGSNTVAWNFSSAQTLNCNDQVLIVGLRHRKNKPIALEVDRRKTETRNPGVRRA